jgi:hypothetical protein
MPSESLQQVRRRKDNSSRSKSEFHRWRIHSLSHPPPDRHPTLHDRNPRRPLRTHILTPVTRTQIPKLSYEALGARRQPPYDSPRVAYRNLECIRTSTRTMQVSQYGKLAPTG